MRPVARRNITTDENGTRSDLRDLQGRNAPPFQVQLECNQIQLSPKFASGRLVDSDVEQLAEIKELATKFHLNGKTIRVFQNLEGKSKILRDGVVVLKVERFASSGEVVEDALLLSLANSLFHDSVEESHAVIVPA